MKASNVHELKSRWNWKRQPQDDPTIRVKVNSNCNPNVLNKENYIFASFKFCVSFSFALDAKAQENNFQKLKKPIVQYHRLDFRV